METVVSIAIFAVVSSAGYTLLQYVTQNSLHKDRMLKRARAISEIERFVAPFTTTLTHAMMDPSKSLLSEDASYRAVGGQWNSDPLVRTENVPAVSVLGYEGRPGSHMLLDFKLTLKPDNSVAQEVNAVHFSRCIDARKVPSTNLSNAYVQSLKAPILRNRELFCCDINQHEQVDLAACEKSPFYWPKIFTLNKLSGKVSESPARVDESVMPGAGFIVSFDQNPPTQFYVDLIFMKNNCTAGSILRPNRCVPTISGKVTTANQAQLMKDISVEIKRQSRPVSSDVSSSSFIRLAPKAIRTQ